MYIIKGNIAFTKQSDNLTVYRHGYIGVLGDRIEFVSLKIPYKYNDVPITDYGDNIIIPGFCDLHTHAPQFENLGLGMNQELLPWLTNLTYPTEAKYADTSYAADAYDKAVTKIIRSGSTRVVLFSSVHPKSSQVLVDIMESRGLCGYVGKVNMDRNCPDYIVEDTAESLRTTEQFILKNRNNRYVKPIITPRFAPSCSEELMEGLAKLAKKYDTPIQSHIDENLHEVEWIADLFPSYGSYADVYERFHLLNDRTLMAHCIYMKPEEVELFIKRGVFAVHCPESNCNLRSGLMHLKQLMKRDVKVGLGSDVSGGHSPCIQKSIVLAIQISKIGFDCSEAEDFLSFSEAFYLATKGGGRFFGKVGSFEKGYEFDALIIDDGNLSGTKYLSIQDRLQRFVYIGDDRNIIARYIKGREIIL